MSETLTIVGEGIALDLLLWRKWGDAGRELYPATLALNPALAERLSAEPGVTLPVGTVIVLPAPPTATELATVATDLFS